MANVHERQIIQEGWRNFSVKFVGTIDSADPAIVPALSLTDLINNDAQLTLDGLRIDEVTWSLSDGLQLALEWDATDPQKIVEVATHGKVEACQYGGLIPDRLRPGYSGGLNLRTRGYAPGTTANYTILVGGVKLYRR